MLCRKLQPLLYKTVSVKFTKLFLKRSMSVTDLKEIFQKSVESVQPQNLIRKELKLHQGHLSVRGQSYPLHKPCYVVGFGKAVLGMSTEIERVFGDSLERGVVTVPIGIFKKYARPKDSKIIYIEGAKNNLPDKDAEKGALMIKELVEGLTENDLLIVLISGGGSALLPLPVPPITLEEKVDVIRKLAKKGANIRELNTLRKQISALKGGGLAEMAHPCRVISLVLSDIVDDPLDFIASGPTVVDRETADSAVQILKKYSLYDQVQDSIKGVLKEEGKRRSRPANVPIVDGEYGHVRNYIIGNNRIAAEAARDEALTKGLQSTVVSTCIDGDANEISKIYTQMARHLAAVISEPSNKEHLRGFLEGIVEELRARRGFVEEVLGMDFSRPICLIFAGEPTVVVSGTGRGGRNQQLALAFSLQVNNPEIKSADISLLSCGTDGIDGPTDAAGAVASNDASWQRLEEAEGLVPQTYLDNNDAYSFYERYEGGRNLIKTGHTGTNVMDIHLMLIVPKRN